MLPALVTVPLAAGLGGIVQAIFTILAEVMTRKLAFRVALVSSLIAAFGVYALVIQTAIGAVFMTMPPLLQNSAYFLPGNLGLCLATLSTARAAKWVWQMKRDIMMPFGAM